MCSPYPKISCPAVVASKIQVSSTVCLLSIARTTSDALIFGDRGSIPLPVPGQFFMLRARPSQVLLGRPISVYRYDERTITFLVLNKGKGTAELCNIIPGQQIDLIGPIGNFFPQPDSPYTLELLQERSVSVEINPVAPKTAVIGGGIGIAPVAGFALSLPQHSFDFFASFRSETYGLDGIDDHAKNLCITTEDGSRGEKGMLSDVFNPELYDLIYACGPTPMLKYLQASCANSLRQPVCFLSLEQYMACGAGACLGCTVRTIHGNKRCCVDGPVFTSTEVLL